MNLTGLSTTPFITHFFITSSICNLTSLLKRLAHLNRTFYRYVIRPLKNHFSMLNCSLILMFSCENTIVSQAIFDKSLRQVSEKATDSS